MCVFVSVNGVVRLLTWILWCVFLRYDSLPPQTSKHKQKLVATMTGSHSPNGLRDEAAVKQTWAEYIALFVSAYAKAGVSVWAGKQGQVERVYMCAWIVVGMCVWCVKIS